MANEKNGFPVAKIELKKEVVFRRRKFEIKDEETNEVVVGEYIEVTCKFAGETVRFKVDDKSSKMVKALMRMNEFDGVREAGRQGCCQQQGGKGCQGQGDQGGEGET